VIYTYHLSLLG